MDINVLNKKIYKELDLEAGTYENTKVSFENQGDKNYITAIFTLTSGRELRINFFENGGRSIIRLASEIVRTHPELEACTVGEIIDFANGKEFTLYVNKFAGEEKIFTNYNLAPQPEVTTEEERDVPIFD